MIAALAVCTFGAQAAFYSWTDFKDDNRFVVNTAATAEAGDAYNAALEMIGGLKSGVIPRNLRLIDREGCVSPTSFGPKAKALSEFIAEGRYNNSKVEISGFTISTYYTETGAAVYKATVKGDMPCLKKDAD